MSLLALLDSSLTATRVGNATLRSRWGLTLPPRRTADVTEVDHTQVYLTFRLTVPCPSLAFFLEAHSQR